MRIIFFALILLTLQTTAEASLLDDAIKEREGKKTVQSTNSEKSFVQNHFFVFFYASTCPYCHDLAPNLAKLVKLTGLDVLPLSIDGQQMEEFPHFAPATSEWINIAFKERAVSYPALFIASKKHRFIYPVSFGTLSFDELRARFSALIPKIQAYERDFS